VFHFIVTTLMSHCNIMIYSSHQLFFGQLFQWDWYQVPSTYSQNYECDIMSIKQQHLCLPASSLLSFVPNLCDIFEDHIEKIIEASENASKLSFALHYQPKPFSNTLVE